MSKYFSVEKYFIEVRKQYNIILKTIFLLAILCKDSK